MQNEIASKPVCDQPYDYSRSDVWKILWQKLNKEPCFK